MKWWAAAKFAGPFVGASTVSALNGKFQVDLLLLYNVIAFFGHGPVFKVLHSCEGFVEDSSGGFGTPLPARALRSLWQFPGKTNGRRRGTFARKETFTFDFNAKGRVRGCWNVEMD